MSQKFAMAGALANTMFSLLIDSDITKSKALGKLLISHYSQLEKLCGGKIFSQIVNEMLLVI